MKEPRLARGAALKAFVVFSLLLESINNFSSFSNYCSVGRVSSNSYFSDDSGVNNSRVSSFSSLFRLVAREERCTEYNSK